MKGEIKYIVVHCTAGVQTANGDDLKRYFKSLSWSRPGYHYIVRADGAIEPLWPEYQYSNGVKGHNDESINVAWVGGIDNKGKAIDNRTGAQKVALKTLLKELKLKYKDAIIQGHRDFSEDKNKNGIIDPWERMKECPCFDAKIEYKDL